MKYNIIAQCVLLVLLNPLQGIKGEFVDSFEDSAEKIVDSEDKRQPLPMGLGDTPVVRAAKVAQIPAGAPPAQFPGSSHGSNYAGFNQRCVMDSEQGIRCNPLIGLTCDMKVCKCKNSTIEQDLINVYSPLSGKCLRVARSAENWACEQDIQCRFSRQGNYSQCNFRSNRCECVDIENLGREVLLINDVCYVKKDIGSQCSNDLECQTTIKGNAVCMGVKSQLGVCQCAGDHSYDTLLGECLELGKTEDAPCKSDRQCNDEMALGELSRCNPSTGRCQCYDTKGNGNFLTGYYKFTQKCYYKKKQEQQCNFREECFLGYHRKSDCLPHPAYNDEKVCQCPPNETCAGNGLFSSFSILLVAAAVGILKFF